MGSLLNGFWIDFEGSWGHCRGVSAGHLATDWLDFGVVWVATKDLKTESTRINDKLLTLRIDLQALPLTWIGPDPPLPRGSN